MTPQHIYDLELRDQLYLEQYKQQVANGLSAGLRATEAQLVAALSKLPSGKLNGIPASQLKQLLRELRDLEEPAAYEQAADVINDFPELARASVEGAAANLAVFTAEDIKLPVHKQVFAEVLRNPLSANGQLLQPFVDSMAPRQVKLTENAVRKAWTNGQTTQELIQAIRGTKARGFKDGITAMKTREAEALARTAIQHVASASRQELYKENPDIVTGYTWVSTLDGSTTSQCRFLDKKTFPVGKGPLPPLHIRCRSTTVPDLSDGLDFLDEGATRSSAFGPVDAKQSYYDWLAKQDRPFVEGILGKDRAKLFLDNNLKPEQYAALSMDKNFKPRTLASMQAEMAKASSPLLMEPAAGTATGRVWAISRELTATLGRQPTSAELLAVTRAEGLNDATARTQFAQWKKEWAEVSPTPAPTKTPAPTVVPITPAVKPTAGVLRTGMPASGATRTVWQTATDLEAELGREPTRSELLAATQKLGLNASTAGTQFSKWKQAGSTGTQTAAPTAVAKPVQIAVPVPAPATVSAPKTAVEKQAAWEAVKAKFDSANSAPLDHRALAERHGISKEFLDKYFDKTTGHWIYYRMTPEEAASARAYQEDLWDAARQADTKQTGTKEAFLAIMKQKRPGALSYSAQAFARLPVGAQRQFREATTMFEHLVHPDLLADIAAKGQLNPIYRSGRGQYDNYNRAPVFDHIKGRGALRTVLHEITHAIEYSSPAVAKQTRNFLRKRAVGAVPIHIPGDAPHAKAYKDKWAERGGSLYSGREYGRHRVPTEILTTGIERLANSPQDFYRDDPEYFEFVYRTLNKLL